MYRISEKTAKKKAEEAKVKETRMVRKGGEVQKERERERKMEL